MSEPRNTHVLITGTPAEGFTIYGPITPGDPDLEQFTDVDLRNEYWWYQEIKALPTAQPKDTSKIHVLTVETNQGEDVSVHPDESSVEQKLRELLEEAGELPEGEAPSGLVLAELMGQAGIIYRIDEFNNPHA